MKLNITMVFLVLQGGFQVEKLQLLDLFIWKIFARVFFLGGLQHFSKQSILKCYELKIVQIKTTKQQ